MHLGTLKWRTEHKHTVNVQVQTQTCARTQQRLKKIHTHPRPLQSEPAAGGTDVPGGREAGLSLAKHWAVQRGPDDPGTEWLN